MAVSTASIFIRFAQEEVASIVVAAYRLSIAAIVLAVIVLVKYRSDLKKLTRREIWLTFMAGLFLAIHFAAWITSLQYTTVVSSVVLVTTTPLWVAIAAPLTIKEPITRMIAIGLLIAMVGTFVVGLSDACAFAEVVMCPPIGEFVQGTAFLGDLLALIGAWVAAGYVIIGRSVRERMEVVPYIFLVYGFAAIILIGMAVFSGQPLTGFSRDSYLWLALLGLVPQLIGHSIYNWSLGYLPAAFVAVTLLGEPIGTSILAFLVLDETPGWVKLVGGALILGGITIASLKPARDGGKSKIG
ncbi:MAG: DMT family transporter [Anaerolineales bacterium]